MYLLCYRILPPSGQILSNTVKVSTRRIISTYQCLTSCKYFQSPTQRTIHILVLNVVCHNVGMYCYITMIAVSKYCVYCKSIKLFVLKFLSKTRRYVNRSDSFGQRPVTVQLESQRATASQCLGLKWARRAGGGCAMTKCYRG